jgi:beta-xylosidase
MSTAEQPDGPWSPLLQVKNVEMWEDPCPFWDDDGSAYLIHSLHGAGPIIIHKMSVDGTHLLDDGKIIYTGFIAEGPKMFKREGYYYISIPEGGVATGWQTILRSKNIYGPYEKKVVLEKGRTCVNGPHQGAFVDTPDGEWWFYHFQSVDPIGRVVHLQPVFWQEGWPFVGVDLDRNGIGEPVYVWKKPAINKTTLICAPQTDDDFNKPQLGLQWQFNHNQFESAWSLTENRGFLSLKSLKGDCY